MKLLKDYSLLNHNTFHIDVRCKRYAEYESVEEAQAVAEQLRSSDSPYIIIGGGSNLLLTGDFPGIVVRSAIRGITFEGNRVKCGSGMVWDDVVEECVRHGRYGTENLSLIPGDVGAVAVQNIGAYGVEAKDIIEQVHTVEISTGRVCVFSRNECDYGYRHSRFKAEWRNKYLVTQVDFLLDSEFMPHVNYGNIQSELQKRGISEPSATDLREVIIDIRKAKLPDPAVLGNAGSFFMNPIVTREKYEELSELYEGMPHYYIDRLHEKIPAGWLIEQCGWKGGNLGPVAVHDKQALVLVNKGGASGKDVLKLSDAIRSDVKAKFGIDIMPEVNIV